MHIPINRVPDAGSEHEAERNALWMQSLNRFKAMAEEGIGRGKGKVGGLPKE
ncbi:hypothetical protein [Rhodanobacter thiooxydans]|uniref:hypothetical protein n=1 Tax=Rhodanobacter thiooxydans TaxID=416169 RepID=UPI0002F0EB12|nr:hypothetical protein [Rhodanobacter thiooxydans]